MPLQPLEERVAVLETEITQLKQFLKQEDVLPTAWWEQIAGTFADDPAFDEAMLLGRQYQAEQRSTNVEPHRDDVPA